MLIFFSLWKQQLTCVENLRNLSPTYQPQETKLEALIEYCEQIHVEVQVVPEGMHLKPPKERAVVLDCNPNIEQDMKMLDYLFEISASNEDAEHNSDEQSDDDEGAWE